MSLENNLKRIADALEKIAEVMIASSDNPAVTTDVPAPTPTSAATPAAPVNPPQPEAPAAPPAPASAAEVPPAPVAEQPADVVPTAVVPPAPQAAPAPTMTAEELNAALVEEFKRIGDRAPIDAAITGLGATSVTDLPVERYQELIDAVKAIQV